jgi:uncharacterized protein with ATP-grasp and redox domains
MKTYLDCIPCFMNQALRAARIASSDETKIKLILDNVGDCIKNFSLDTIPPIMGEFIYKEVSRISGNPDPYKEIKKKHIAEALELIPHLKTKINNSKDKLLTAIKIAIAGNVIDLGVEKSFNIKNDIETIIKQDFAISDYEQFKIDLKKATFILYIGDNAGESVFDSLLIEQLKLPVIYVTREKAVINDCTYQDAIDSKLDEVASIISSGCSAPSTIFNKCNKEFLDLYNKATLIISKGQGNFEGLSNSNRPIYFLLKAKCKLIAKHLDVIEDSIVLKKSEYKIL